MIPAPILFADAAYDRLKPKDKAAYLNSWSKSSADPTTKRTSTFCLAALFSRR